MWDEELIKTTLETLKSFRKELWKIDCVDAAEGLDPAIEVLEKHLIMLEFLKIRRKVESKED
jgi:hypothetical protein